MGEKRMVKREEAQMNDIPALLTTNAPPALSLERPA
jgi:hypothetical protein